MVGSQKFELLVVVVQVKVMVDEEYLVVEREVVEYLVVEHLLQFRSLDYQGFEDLDFMVWELKCLGQKSQYQTELWQVLVEFVQDLD